MARRRNRTTELAALAAAECACEGFRRASRALSRVYASGLAPFSLTPTQFAILVALHRHGGSVAFTRLAERLVLDRTSLYRALAPLRRRRVLRVGPGATARERVATLTSDGQRLIAVALPVWEQTQQRFVDTLGARRWKALRSALARVLPAIQAIDPAGPAGRRPTGQHSTRRP